MHFISCRMAIVIGLKKAESLGWREPPKDQEEKYLKTVKRDSMKGGM